ncbi:MAG TPA: hypothetical protein VEK79_02925 [Thermoanaerobaculia bacterium]|nr:hypothetical protein [Thermoanaerobaculia bacterium]
MKRLGWIFLATALFVTLPLGATETLMQCMINCPPGVNACSNCCFSQFDGAKGPCFDACVAAPKSCFDAAWRSCQGKANPQYCYMVASQPCQTAIFACQRNCDSVVQIAGGCPGEVPPQKCPYNCQMWNSASQSCIGPAMNACGNMLQSAAADAADDEAEIHAARAKAAADAAAAHTEKLSAENAQKTKKKK